MSFLLGDLYQILLRILLKFLFSIEVCRVVNQTIGKFATLSWLRLCLSRILNFLGILIFALKFKLYLLLHFCRYLHFVRGRTFCMTVTRTHRNLLYFWPCEIVLRLEEVLEVGLELGHGTVILFIITGLLYQWRVYNLFLEFLIAIKLIVQTLLRLNFLLWRKINVLFSFAKTHHFLSLNFLDNTLPIGLELRLHRYR